MWRNEAARETTVIEGRMMKQSAQSGSLKGTVWALYVAANIQQRRRDNIGYTTTKKASRGPR